MKFCSLLLAVCFGPQCLVAQQASIYGRVTNPRHLPVPNALVTLPSAARSVHTDSLGRYALSEVKPGAYTVVAYRFGLKSSSKEITIGPTDVRADFELDSLFNELEGVTITSEKENTSGIARLKSVEGVAIYASKKNEVIILSEVTANLATNNARQVFGKVPGLNIWESDGAGIQLGIGARGLNPKRTSEFNTRQNGYDMSADALGYPESYYTPPTEALERIEVVRGAASLQYGTQFGGMINFVMKKGTREKPVEFLTRQTGGSFGLFSSFNSLGGTRGKVNYYAFYQHKQGHEWRPNSGFTVDMGYANLNYRLTPKLSLSADVTLMGYQAQQPGGLTDAMFRQDARQSVRQRNWFAVSWNLASFSLDYQLSLFTKLNTRTFGLIATRKALGFLGSINRGDDGTSERDLLADEYRNFGNETRLLHQYTTFGHPSTILIGTRYYQGLLDRKQGMGNAAKGADFYYLHPGSLEKSDYDFPSRNFAAFAENIFSLTSKFSITPGIRYEHIRTAATGYWRDQYTDIAGNVIFDQIRHENKSNNRSFFLLGLGMSYHQSEALEAYGNISQNYKAINFNDMRVDNPSLLVDQHLKDEQGFNADLGLRGNLHSIFSYDISLFYLAYQGRIGTRPLENSEKRIRTNIGDSRHVGIESFAEVNILKLFTGEKKNKLLIFSNITFADARYIRSEVSAIVNNRVELAPSSILRIGSTFQHRTFQATLQFSHTGSHYTDATNSASASSNAVIGIIPSYNVTDLSLRYTYRKFTIETGCNNLFNEVYFTRRADSYPGPGIIPANARSFYITLGVKL